MIARAMAKAPEERFATCREMIEAARAALGGRAPAPPARRRSSRTPRRAAPRSTSNLPVLATPLVGREAELAEVDRAARRSRPSRLVTLTGLGGTGKTRLALEAATTVRGRLRRRRYFVDLVAGARPRPRRLGDRARCSASREAPDRPLAEAIAERLGRRADADRARQLRAGARRPPRSSASCSPRAPSLKVVATSRAPLRVRGEREYPVPPLAVPEPARSRGRSPTRPPSTLFVERAQEAKPSFELRTRTSRRVAEICRRLEGIPLAIELAAARVKLMTPRADRRPARREAALLPHRRRAAARTPLTLRRDRVELQPARRPRQAALFARLGVFVGGASLETAETVAGAPLGLEFGEVLDGVAVARRQRPRPAGRGRRRRAAVPHARDDPRVRARAARPSAASSSDARTPARSSATSSSPRPPSPSSRAAGQARVARAARARRTTTSAPRSPGRSSRARSSSGCGSPARSSASGASAA